MMTKDSYNDLRDRVAKFGNEYFDNAGEALLKEMEAFISGESNEFETDIVENVLKNETYTELVKKEAEEILNDATRAKGDMADIHKMLGTMSPFNDTFIQDGEMESRWKLVETKQVPDSDGMLTDYSWYKDDEGHHIMIFGDTDLYTPDNSSPDWEADSEAEAKEWFDNYEGFEDEDFDPLQDYTDEMWAYYDDTPSGILNLDDSCATEDSNANDTFVQDEVRDPNDKREVILYNKWKTISNSLEEMRNELAKHKLTAEDLEKPENKELKELYNRYRDMSKTFQKVDAMLNNYRKQRDEEKFGYSINITDEDANAPEVEEDLFDVIGRVPSDTSTYGERKVIATNVPKAKAEELVEQHKQKYPGYYAFYSLTEELTKKRKNEYYKSSEFIKYSDLIDEKIEKEVTAEFVFDEEELDLGKLVRDIVPDEILEDDIKAECYDEYTEERYNDQVKEMEQSSEYEDLEEQAAADRRDYEAMVDYYWYHR